MYLNFEYKDATYIIPCKSTDHFTPIAAIFAEMSGEMHPVEYLLKGKTRRSGVVLDVDKTVEDNGLQNDDFIICTMIVTANIRYNSVIYTFQCKENEMFNVISQKFHERVCNKDPPERFVFYQLDNDRNEIQINLWKNFENNNLESGKVIYAKIDPKDSWNWELTI